ncbi:MAG TPA: copper homeostasis protein CutC [Candidatus Angelobacter sp.]|nr:copper homeostasis protein CutC [Candidatus Angelobacter sp.]
MAKRFTLEISVQTVEAALAAERGGADRIELCADLNVGGLTPSRELLRGVREAVGIPVFSMIRPRGGDFVYSAEEYEEMRRAIAVAKESRMDGLVLGILHEDRRVDVERTRELVGQARPLPATFHRAFDECHDLQQSLEVVIQTGAARILTSGGAKSALEGATVLASLNEAASERIVIVPGAGISAANVAEVVQQTGAREFHSGLSTALPYHSRAYRKFEAEVRKLAERLKGLP